MKKLAIALCVVLSALFVGTGCTQNQMAKQFGGTAKIELPAGKKLVVATWKDQSLWYLTRDRRSDEKAENYTFQEESSFGMVEGKVIFIEK